MRPSPKRVAFRHSIKATFPVEVRDDNENIGERSDVGEDSASQLPGWTSSAYSDLEDDSEESGEEGYQE